MPRPPTALAESYLVNDQALVQPNGPVETFGLGKATEGVRLRLHSAAMTPPWHHVDLPPRSRPPSSAFHTASERECTWRRS